MAAVHLLQEKCEAQYELALNLYDDAKYEEAVLAFTCALNLNSELKGARACYACITGCARDGACH